MIRFKDRVFEDYFIDPVTAEITDKTGRKVNTRIHGSYCVVKSEIGLSGIPVHIIQAYTALGYKKGYVVHHIDRNKLNNALSNLMYLPAGEHIRLHRKEDFNVGFGDQKGENNYMYGVKYQWMNNGKTCKLLFEGEQLPEGWSLGRILTDEAKSNIIKAVKNRQITDETRTKLSKAHKGIKFTQEHKDNIRKSLIGKRIGCHFYNNGIKNVIAKECPEGFKQGRI